MIGTIYKHTSPSGKAYIGQTVKFPVELRWKRKEKAYKDGSVFANAIRKYGLENFTHEILIQIESNDHDQLFNDLNFLEELMIAEHDTLFPNGYNLNSGGKHYRRNAETIKQMSEIAKEKWKDPTYRVNVMKNRDYSNPEYRKKLSQVFSAERKQAISVRQKARWARVRALQEGVAA